jgi:hypothetical protein
LTVDKWAETNLGRATSPALVLRFAVNPHGAGKKLSLLMASCNDLIKRNRDFENNKRDDSEFQTRKPDLATCGLLRAYPRQIHHAHQPVLARECQRLVGALRLRHA